jgi:hypothetical protein
MAMSPLALLTLGFFLGMRHATDADHVVAVTTIVYREPTARGAVRIGALWGLGHTVTILVVGGAIIVFGLVIPVRLGLSMELAVAAMLILLGTLNLTGATRRIDRVAHAAVRSDPQNALGGFRPLAVGVVHGLAGSAAIALLVLATIRDVARALLYLGVFGAGTVLGMMLLTTAMTLPIAAASRKFGSIESVMAKATGAVSLVFGLVLVYRIGIVDGLFSGAPSWVPR